MKISWVLLTFNRREKVNRSVVHNILYAGYSDYELIWVDNGSTDGTERIAHEINADVFIKNNRNQGVARGYNQAMAMARGDYIVITGCDMLMPKNWMKTFVEYVERIPETGIACMYSEPYQQKPERARKGKGGWLREERNGLPIVHAMPMGRRIFSRELLGEIGFLREDFGLYGHEDLEWAHRAERVCDEKGLLYYVIPDQVAQHLGTEGVNSFDGNDDRDYHAFKKREVEDPSKERLMSACRAANWPYYNPFPLRRK